MAYGMLIAKQSAVMDAVDGCWSPSRKTGATLQLEVYVPLSAGIRALALTSYAITFETYYALAKLGFELASGIAVGAERQALGNERFDATRTGAFAIFELGDTGLLVLAAGYSKDDGDGDLNDADSGYFTLHLRAND